MSLINDALKRARVSALQQEAEKSGLDYRAVPAHSRHESWSWVQLAGWLVAAAAITLVLFLALRPSSSSVAGKEPIATSAAESPAPVSLSAAPIHDPSTSESAAATAQPAASAPPSPGALPTEAPERGSADLSEASASGASETTAEAIETPRQPPPQVAPAPPASSPQPQTASRLVDGKVYLRRARSADGSEVELGGIAFSEDRPIAVINGKVVSPGDMVAGFVVLRIEAEQVWLEADSVRIYLALH